MIKLILGLGFWLVGFFVLDVKGILWFNILVILGFGLVVVLLGPLQLDLEILG